MSQPRINLFSDTQTRPTPAMRAAIAAAEVGDEQSFADPSVNVLCTQAAALLGHERAMFLPSGTMANEIAILVHCRPGDEILCDRSAHILNLEGAGPSALAGAQVTGLPGERGVFTAADVAASVRDPANRYAPQTRLVAIENTANLGGGTVWRLDQVEAVATAARDNGLLVHMDGARLMNAVVATGTSAASYGALCDSIWLDLSKGLGCPIGAVLAGSADFIDEAWRWKQRLGGAMRQAGMMAASGSYALAHHIARLADDHANAQRLAHGIASIPGLACRIEHVESNIVFIDVSAAAWTAETVCAAMAERGVRLGAMGGRIRAVTHLDVSTAMIDEALHHLAELMETTPR
ncbi:MAG: threonine aldolase family protein [Geminicoccaceae bacterium]